MAGLKVSLARYGDIAGITWNSRTGELVAGHQRLRALRTLYGDDLQIHGESIIAPTGEIFPIRVVDWDEATAKGALVAANNASITGEWGDGLQELLGEIELDDPELFEGLLLSDLVDNSNSSLKSLGNDPDEMPEDFPEPRTQRGDIWILGDHRLMCGDSTSMNDVGALMCNYRAAMAFTDPPYNVNYEGAAGTIQNDNLGAEFPAFLEAAMRCLLEYTDGACYVCMSSSELDVLQSAWRKAGGHWSTFLIWAKSRFTLGRSDYQRQYEPILYGWREGSKHHWCGDRTQGDVWECDTPISSKLHPTMKPTDLIARAIRNSSEPGDIVLDLFGGSGSTLIACEASNRRALLMELDPKFCDVIVTRWERFTGMTANLERSAS